MKRWVLFSLFEAAVNGSETNGNKIRQNARKRTLTRRTVHWYDKILYSLKAIVLWYERHQIVLHEHAHARIAAKVAVVFEYALHDGREHFDDYVRARTVSTVATKKVAYFRRRMILLQQWTQAHDHLFVRGLRQMMLLQYLRYELQRILIDFTIFDRRCQRHINHILILNNQSINQSFRLENLPVIQQILTFISFINISGRTALLNTLSDLNLCFFKKKKFSLNTHRYFLNKDLVFFLLPSI